MTRWWWDSKTQALSLRDSDPAWGRRFFPPPILTARMDSWYSKKSKKMLNFYVKFLSYLKHYPQNFFKCHFANF